MGIVSSEQVPAPHSKPWRHSLFLPLQKLLKSDPTSLGDGFRPHGELGGSNRIELGSINDKELEGCTLNIQPSFF